MTVGAPAEFLRESPGGGPLLESYDVAPPSGDRFLMWKPASSGPETGPRLVFIQNALEAPRR